jgi:hypothetical protein
MSVGGQDELLGEQDELFSQPSQPTINRVKVQEGSSITKLSEPLKEHNWIAWHEHMKHVL